MKKFTITELHANKRIDRVIRSCFPKTPLSAIFKAFRSKKIQCNNIKVKQDYRVSLGDEVQCYFQSDVQAQNKAKQSGVDFEKLKSSSFYKKNLRVLYEDNEVLALDKPSGIAVHPGSKHYHGRTMIDIAQAYTAPSEFQTTLVHRLDIETSGVLLFAKTPESLRNLNAQMKEKAVEKKYYALCKGVLNKDSGTINLALERTEGRQKSTKIIASRGGRNAKMSVTHFNVVQRFSRFTLIDVSLETGRMHQIRVHMKSQGHPLIGDGHYGDYALNRTFEKAPYNLKRIFLHAYFLEFIHPQTNKKVMVESELAAELRFVVEELSD
jgi:23S rRNA pseudouridine955/2504/2580 synthase